MKISLGADHAGYEMKEVIKKHLVERGDEVEDFGTTSSESTDYPQYGVAASRAVADGRVDRGILFCGSGQGMCMTGNKVHGIRAALAWTPEIARLSRQHNDANVLCLPARFMSDEEAIEVVDEWLAAAFEGGRHERRVHEMMDYEKEE